MTALDLTTDFDRLYGVTYLPSLRDGAGFTGRVRRVARRLGLEQDRRDRELFDAYGGRAMVEARLFAKWRDPARGLRDLTPAEERLLLMISVETQRTAPLAVLKVSDAVGFGVFATAPIRARDVIAEYAGVLRKPGPADSANHYLAETPAYGAHDGFVIDGRDEGNVSRFINHSHRAANVSNEFVFHLKRWHRILRADRDVRPGEQILWDYGPAYWRAREAPAEL